MSARVLTAAAFSAALALAPAVHAADWHHGYRGHYYHGGGGAAGAAIVGGIVGLGLGAALASNAYNGYAAPPPVYYGAPSGYYAAPPPPAVYYGYGY
jgi:hypothetical protein